MSSATFILASRDPEIIRAWWVLVPSGARVVTLSEIVQGDAILVAGAPLVTVVEESVVGELPAICLEAPMIFVGDHYGEVFERLSLNATSPRICLNATESQTRLGQFLPLLEEIATRGATENLLRERATQPLPAPAVSADDRRSDIPDTWWDWMGDAVEAVGDRAQLVDEFRRIVKRTMRTSHAMFFLREEGGFRADRDAYFCPASDPIAHHLSRHPVFIDETPGGMTASPVVELSIRQRMAIWGARLIVPMHDNGRLAGWIGLGVREDGLPYDAADRARLSKLVRLMRQMLAKTAGRSGGLEKSPLAAKYLPGAAILGAHEAAPESWPAAVRTLIADVRQLRADRSLVPGPGQPYRARAGMIEETQGVWIFWEDAGGELQEQHRRARAERLALLHDLALTLNHELGNSLVSLAALRHNPGAETNSPVLLAAIKRDIAALEAINRHLASLPTFSEVSAERVDLRALVCAVGRKCAVTVETGPRDVMLDVAPKLIEFGLESIVESIAENRPGLGKRELMMSLRTIDAATAVISIRGAGLALEGILPAPRPGAAPTHGRIGVFIAKEIVHLHGGTIEPGAGTNGPEILITIRQW